MAVQAQTPIPVLIPIPVPVPIPLCLPPRFKLLLWCVLLVAGRWWVFSVIVVAVVTTYKGCGRLGILDRALVASMAPRYAHRMRKHKPRIQQLSKRWREKLPVDVHNELGAFW